MSNELDRLLFFEQARKISEDTYAANPLDADVRFCPSFDLILFIYFFSIKVDF